MRRAFPIITALALLCCVLIGWAVSHRTNWYTQNFRQSFLTHLSEINSSRYKVDVLQDTIVIQNLSNGDRLVCAQVRGLQADTTDIVPILIGTEFGPTLFGTTMRDIPGNALATPADRFFLKTFC